MLTRGSADVGAQVEQMREQVATPRGRARRAAPQARSCSSSSSWRSAPQLDEQLAKIKPRRQGRARSERRSPRTSQAHFQAAYDAYQAADYDKARALWKEYVTRYPNDAKAGDAQYWIGATYTQQNKPATALGEYRKVIAEHAKSNAVNVALYGMADAFYRLHACTDAKSALQALIKRKPESALNDRAKKLLKDVEKAAQGLLHVLTPQRSDNLGRMSDAPAHAGRLPAGTRLGSYRLVRCIGEGGMGTVYEGVHEGLGKRVAIKTLHAQSARSEEVTARFLREGKAAAKIHHPNVVDVSDVAVHDGTPYLVMEYLRGRGPRRARWSTRRRCRRRRSPT